MQVGMRPQYPTPIAEDFQHLGLREPSIEEKLDVALSYLNMLLEEGIYTQDQYDSYKKDLTKKRDKVRQRNHESMLKTKASYVEDQLKLDLDADKMSLRGLGEAIDAKLSKMNEIRGGK